MAAASNSVTVALTNGSGLEGTLTVMAQNGIATFSNLNLSSTGNYALSASSSGLSSASSASFTVSTPGGGGNGTSPVKLAFLVQPSNALIQATISPAVQVAVENSNGNVVSAGSDSVTLNLTNGSGLGGTLTAPALNGVATFSNLTMSTAGSGYIVISQQPWPHFSDQH